MSKETYSGDTQQDGSEFLNSFMDFLNLHFHQFTSTSSLDLDHYYTKRKNPIQESFEIELSEISKCTTCSCSTVKAILQPDIHLAIHASGKLSIDDLILKYFVSDRIQKCSQCKKNEMHDVKLFINNPPPNLVLHLKRSDYDNGAVRNKNPVNIKVLVSFVL